MLQDPGKEAGSLPAGEQGIRVGKQESSHGWVAGEGKGPLPHRTSISSFVEGNNHSIRPAILSLIHLSIRSFSHLLSKHLLSIDRTRLDAAVCQ